MSVPRTGELLLRCYPRAWRARYGDELQGLISEFSDGGRVPWRVRADVALSGARERLRAAALGGDGAPGARVLGGALLVLCAWALFVVAGVWLQRISEHWQAATPAADRSLAEAAFAAVMIVAVCGAALVMAGIAVALPRVAAFLRAGGWAQVRGRVVAASLLAVLAVVATAGLVVWAHGLSGPERAGHDTGYAVGFLACALLLVACLAAWTATAVSIARRIALPGPVLRVQAWLACAVTVTMAVMTAATGAWWAASASAFAPGLAVVMALMLVATLAGTAGARRAWRGLPELSGDAG